MQSPDRAVNPFSENRPTVAQLRSDYQTMLTAADREFKKVESLVHAADPRIVQGWQQRREEKAVKAAQFVIEQVGRMSADDLHQAVEPEDLKDVLLRGGAGLEVFLVLGEYEDADVEKVAETRQEQIKATEASIEALKDGNTRLSLGLPLAKLKQAESKLIEDEKTFKAQKGIRNKVQVGSYISQRRDYEDRLGRLAGDIERAKAKAA